MRNIERFEAATVCTYPLTGGPGCSPGNRGNRGNSAACSKSFYSTCADSLWPMPAMPFPPAGPTRKTTRATEEPWPTPRVNIAEPQVSRARLQVENPDHSSFFSSYRMAALPFLRPAAVSPSHQPKLDAHPMKGPPLRVHSLLPGPNTPPHRALSTSLSTDTKSLALWNPTWLRLG